jgi:ABC-2 type transport system permease protein
MTTIVRYMLLRLRGQVIGWGLALAVWAIIVASLYNTAVQMREQLEQLLSTFPREVMAFVGSLDRLFSPAGFLDTRFFSMMPLILGVFVVIVASGLIASDEENGTLDLILAHPIRRSELFIGRWLAFLGALAGILFIAYLGLVIAIGLSSIQLNGFAVALPFVSLFGISVWFGGLAWMLSMIVPSRRMAASLSGLVLVASYFITTLARVSVDLAALARWSPITYFQGGNAMDNFNVGDFVGLILISIVFAAIGLWRFQRRDIRIAGEGGWQFAARRRRPLGPSASA